MINGSQTEAWRCAEVTQNVSLPLWIDAATGGTSNTTAPGHIVPYFVFSFASFSFVVIFGVCLAVAFYLGHITETDLKFPHFLLFLVGMFDALNGVLVVNASSGSRTAPYLQAILGNFTIPITMLLRLLVLKKKPTQRKFICSILVLLSLFICLLPKIIPALGADTAPGAKGAAGVLWPLCFMIGFVPAAAMNVIEEKVMKMTKGTRRDQISLIWFLFWESVYQFLCAAALFWTDVIPGFGNSADIHDFGENVAFGFLCFFGGRGCTSEPGTRGTVFILGYAVSYFGGGLLLRHAEGATLLALVTSLVTPLGFLFWTLFEEDPFQFHVNTGNATWFSLGALVLMVPAIYFYNTGLPERSTDDTRTGLGVTDTERTPFLNNSHVQYGGT
ncbi:crt homolog 3-like [Branchiostoma floridae x Branchiostoma japonicum]